MSDTPATRYDTIVVGLGGMGSAALYHLSKRKQKVLGLEQFSVAHDRGSSHGESRIIRLAYHEHPDYVPLLLRAYTLWQKLQEEAGQELLCVTGSVEAASPEVPSDHKSVFRDALASAQLHNLEHEVLTGAETNCRFPGYSLPDDHQVLYQPQGGLLLSERCIQAHVAIAKQHGATVRTHEAVQGWHVDDSAAGQGDVVVVTDRGQYRCKKVVMAAGAWMARLVPALQACTSVQRNVIGWFDILQAGHFDRRCFPVYILQHKDQHFYGFPQYKEPGMKIGLFYHLREAADDPHQLSRTITAEDEQVLRICVDRCFPTAGGKLNRAKACMFTNTPDSNFILDFHPQHEQVVLCSACSGHGYKFCSVIGEILADLAIKGSTDHAIGAHRISANRAGHKELIQQCQTEAQQFQEQRLRDMHAPASRL